MQVDWLAKALDGLRLSGEARREEWPLREPFAISRSSRTAAEVLYIVLEADGARGQGEGQPNPRYQQDGARDARLINDWLALRPRHSEGIWHPQTPGGLSLAGRNALENALVDLAVKRGQTSFAAVSGLDPADITITTVTVSLAAPEAMAIAARRHVDNGFRALKLKLGGVGDSARMRAVQQSVPDADLIVDANEAWTAGHLERRLRVAADCGVSLVEQPLPAGGDMALADIDHPVPICADESFSEAVSPAALSGRYDVVNVKLDKCGGIGAATAAVMAAREADMDVMLGCMLGTSLAVAPALYLAPLAVYVDLDAPLLLARDRTPSLLGPAPASLVAPPPLLWG